MTDPILDETEELIRRERGDPEVLHRIVRAARRGEVISVYERNYVEGLTKEFIRPRTARPAPVNMAARIKQEAAPAPRKRRRGIGPLSRLKSRKIAFLAAAVLAVAISAAIYTGSDTESPELPAPATGLSVSLDSDSYLPGDIISISGVALHEGEVSLMVSDGMDRIVWSEDVLPDGNGAYSRLLIAGGPDWQSGGTYVLSATHDGITKQATFSFGG